MDSILESIKDSLHITDNAFDDEIIMHTNSTLMTLQDIGVGPSRGFRIAGNEETWSDFLGDATNLEDVKTYVYMKVRLIFDPPENTSIVESMKAMATEYEWRLNMRTDPYEGPGDNLSGGGVTDYEKLENLPSINGEKLIGNYEEKDPTVKTMETTDVDDMWNEVFKEGGG